MSKNKKGSKGRRGDDILAQVVGICLFVSVLFKMALKWKHLVWSAAATVILLVLPAYTHALWPGLHYNTYRVTLTLQYMSYINHFKIPWYPKLLFQRENALASF
jgi:hypothetical protein